MMDKMYVILGLLASAILVGGFIVVAASLPGITSDQANGIAVDTVNEDDVGVLTDVELEDEEGNTVYAVEFNKDGFETDVKIDASSGKVVKIEDDTTEEDADVDDAEEADDFEADDDMEEQQVDETALETVQSPISEDMAREIALSAEDGRITDVELEKEGGVLVYAVELRNSHGEVDVKIDVSNGNIVKIERDDEEDGED
ncbi:MAG: PepSY domain-containing protein [Candidatus Altiarchaeota archaeon]